MHLKTLRNRKIVDFTVPVNFPTTSPKLPDTLLLTLGRAHSVEKVLRCCMSWFISYFNFEPFLVTVPRGKRRDPSEEVINNPGT